MGMEINTKKAKASMRMEDHMKSFVLLLGLLLVFYVSLFSQDTIRTFEQEVKEIKERVSPSLVKVIAENHKRYIATGVAIEKDLVLTTMLVTRHPYERIYVKTVTGETVPAKVVGKDKYQAIILLRLKDKVMRPIRIAENPEVGDWIALVGVFYNRFPAIFHGIVSSIAQDEMILNAPVFPGSPGGAVVNKKGELVAVIRGRFGVAVEPDLSVLDQKGELIMRGQKIQSKSLCFAVPASMVRDITGQLKRYGRVRRGWLGVHLWSGSTESGAVIASLTARSPALTAGLKEGDRIVSINGVEIGEISDVGRIVRSLAPGHVARIMVERGRHRTAFDVELGELTSNDTDSRTFRFTVPRSGSLPEPFSPFPQPEGFVFNLLRSRRLGVDILEITPDLAGKFKIKEGHGLMVSRIHKDGVAGRSGIQAGDVIVRADKQPIHSLSDFWDVLDRVQGNRRIAIEYYRDGDLQRRTVVLESGFADSRGWEEFRDRMHTLSDRFFTRFILESKNAWRREHAAMLARLRELKETRNRIPEQELKNIEAKIQSLETAYRRALEGQLKQIQEKQRLLQQETVRFRAEEERLKLELQALKKKILEANDEGSSKL
jgi:serine protease Do